MWIWNKFLKPWYNHFFGLPAPDEASNENKTIEHHKMLNEDDEKDKEMYQSDALYCTVKGK